MKKIKVPKKLIPQFKLWLENLRNDKYKQGRHTLYNRCFDTYCCLGVCANSVLNISNEDMISYDMPDGLYNHINHDKLIIFKFLDEKLGDVAIEGSEILAWLNDGLSVSQNIIDDLNKNFDLDLINDKKYSFKEIADIIEKIYNLEE